MVQDFIQPQYLRQIPDSTVLVLRNAEQRKAEAQIQVVGSSGFGRSPGRVVCPLVGWGEHHLATDMCERGTLKNRSLVSFGFPFEPR